MAPLENHECFSTLPSSITFRDLVDAAKLRWRIERDYQELKQEVGLGHCLRIAGLRKGDDSPLRTSSGRAAPATCRSRPLPTPRILHCDLSATSQTRSPPCADASSTLSLDACHDVRAVAP